MSLPPRPAAKHSVRAGERDAGNHGGFERKGAKVFRFEIVHVGTVPVDTARFEHAVSAKELPT